MDKVTSAYQGESRFVQGGKVTIKKKAVGWWERSPFLSKRADDDIIIESLPAQYNGRPDLLAYDMYGSNNLEWLVLQYNKIVDINEEFATGARLVLPTKFRVYNSMLINTVDYTEDDNV